MILKQNAVYDFSSYEDRINWDGIASAGTTAVIMRASAQGVGTRNRWEDVKAVAYMAECKQRAIKTGLYHFLTPNGIAEQAALFLSVWKKCGGADLNPIVDVEINLPLSYGGTIGNAVWQSHIKTFIDLVAAGTGKTPMIYTSKNYWTYACTKNFLGQFVAPAWANDYPLWVAQYPNTPDTWTAPLAIPLGWQRWAIWQYAENGRQNGFLANDLNTASDWYAAELGAVVTPPPPVPVTDEFVSATLTRTDGTQVQFVPKV